MIKKLIPFIIIILAVVLILSFVMILRETSQSKEEKQAFDALTEVVVQDEDVKIEEEENVIRKRNLTPLFEENADCVGWVCIEGTALDYPVMHTPNEPQKYLHLSFDKEYSYSGVPFLQESVNMDSDNLILYGHNMKNGSMFATITKYRERSFYEAHSVIEFETAEGLVYYDVFAVVMLKSNDSWYHFITAEDEGAYDQMVKAIKERALYDTGMIPAHGQQLLTLSTCYGENDDDRLILIAAEQMK